MERSPHMARDGHVPEQPPSPTSQESYLENPGSNPEVWHLNFRAFSALRSSDPIQDLRKLSKLCQLWLRPELHTKEQILDQLVLEQFMISMPEDLQALVRESGVKSCRELEEVLRSHRQPWEWSIVVLEGQKFLIREPNVQMAGAADGESDSMVDLSSKQPPSTSKGPPQSSQAGPQPQSPLRGERSEGQGRQVLPNPGPEKGDLEGLRSQQNLGKDLLAAREEATYQRSEETTLLQGPAEYPSKNVHARPRSTHLEQREATVENRQDPPTLRKSKRRRVNETPASQEGPQGAKAASEVRGSRGQPGLSSAGPPAAREARVPLYCQACAKSFQYPSQLTIHRRTHSGERPFKCGTCGKGFLQPSDLRVHQRIHTGEKPFQCRLCHKQFTHESTLHGHRRVHTGEKPFECADCQKRFSHKGNLNVHRRIHTQVKPYTCPDCGRAFRQLGTFNRHKKTHAQGAPARAPKQA